MLSGAQLRILQVAAPPGRGKKLPIILKLQFIGKIRVCAKRWAAIGVRQQDVHQQPPKSQNHSTTSRRARQGTTRVLGSPQPSALQRQSTIIIFFIIIISHERKWPRPSSGRGTIPPTQSIALGRESYPYCDHLHVNICKVRGRALAARSFMKIHDALLYVRSKWNLFRG